MDKKTLSISIITPTLNASKYIQKCLSSVSNQKGVIVEHIIIDGGSIDNTVFLANEHGAKVFVLKDSSIYEALNYGVSIAKAKVVGFLNCDDYYHSFMTLKMVIDSFGVEDDIDIVYGNCRFVDSSGIHLYRLIPNRNLAMWSARVRYFNISHPSWFILKDKFYYFGEYKASLKYVADCDFILKALSYGAKFRYINVDLATFVLHNANASSSSIARNEKDRSFVSWNGNSLTLYLLHYLFMAIMYLRDLSYFKYRFFRIANGR